MFTSKCAPFRLQANAGGRGSKSGVRCVDERNEIGELGLRLRFQLDDLVRSVAQEVHGSEIALADLPLWLRTLGSHEVLVVENLALVLGQFKVALVAQCPVEVPCDPYPSTKEQLSYWFASAGSPAGSVKPFPSAKES